MVKPKIEHLTVLLVGFAIAFSILIVGYLNYKYKMKILESENRQKQEELNTKESKIEEKNDEINIKKVGLELCLDEADLILQNASIKNPTLKINSEDFKIILDYIQNKKEECYKKYPQQ